MVVFRYCRDVSDNCPTVNDATRCTRAYAEVGHLPFRANVTLMRLDRLNVTFKPNGKAGEGWKTDRRDD
jgi:hypothetical protein